MCGWWPVATSAGKSANFLSSGVEQRSPEGWDKGVGPAEFVVFTVVRDEQPYIEEFVQYHLFIGVDLIYLYDNEDEPTYHAMFRCNPRVKVGLGLGGLQRLQQAAAGRTMTC